MYYIEQVFFDNGHVRVTVYSEKVTNGLIFRGSERTFRR